MVKQDFINVNKFSRPGLILREVLGVVVHYTACPGATAQNIRDYFASLARSKDRFGSAHYAVGLQGKIVQVLPESEVAYHCGSKSYTALKELRLGRGNPNFCTVGIEMCHADASGAFHVRTLESTARLAADILERNGLGIEGLLSHQEVVGWKKCPLWFCEHPEDFEGFKALVAGFLGGSDV